MSTREEGSEREGWRDGGREGGLWGEGWVVRLRGWVVGREGEW